MELVAGANIVLPTSSIKLDVEVFGTTAESLDFSAYLLANPFNKVRGDDDMIFYGQLHNRNQTVKLKYNYSLVTFDIDLIQIDSQVNKIAICATLANEQETFANIGYLSLKIKDANKLIATSKITGQGRLEVAMILGELYRYKQQWKFRLVAQGFNGGLRPLAEHFGVEIIDNVVVQPETSNNIPSTPLQEANILFSADIFKNILTSPFRALEKRKRLKEFEELLKKALLRNELTDQDKQALKFFCTIHSLDWQETLKSSNKDIENFLLYNAGRHTQQKIDEWCVFLNASQHTISQVYNEIHRANEQQFQDLLKQMLSDGQLTTHEMHTLENFCKSKNLDLQSCLRKSDTQINNFLHFTLASIVADNVITPEEKTLIENLCRFLKPSQSIFNEINRTIERVNRIEKIRRGDVNVIQTNAIIMKNAEMIWLQQPSVRLWYGKKEILQGDLFVTNERIIYKSTKSLEIPISNIIALDSNATTVYISAKTKRGSADFIVGTDAEIVEAYIHQAVKRFHRQLDLKQTSGNTRHISQTVRNVVWERCQGKCVECSSTLYLEFDHIIPYSKGGSNSEQNLQILCRACNLAKSNQI